MSEVDLTTDLIKFINQLDSNDVRKISHALKIPLELCENLENGRELLLILEEWGRHDPYTFYKKLKSIRPDLVREATEFEWIATEHPIKKSGLKDYDIVQDLSGSLTANEIKKLKSALEFPSDISKYINKPIDFITEIRAWKDHNPFRFDVALSQIRPDLVEKARNLPWLSRRSLLGGDTTPNDSINMHIFVELLRTEILLKEWEELFNPSLLPHNMDDMAEVVKSCIEKDIMKRTLIKLLDTLKRMWRAILVMKLKPYRMKFIRIYSISEFEMDLIIEAYLSNFKDIPPEIRRRSKEFIEEYKKACSEGSVQINYFRLMIVGPEGVGKTCLLKALKNKDFEEGEVSTDFIEKTDITITDLSNDWSENVDFKDRLKETRDDGIAHVTVDGIHSQLAQSKVSPKLEEESSDSKPVPSDVDNQNPSWEDELFEEIQEISVNESNLNRPKSNEQDYVKVEDPNLHGFNPQNPPTNLNFPDKIEKKKVIGIGTYKNVTELTHPSSVIIDKNDSPHIPVNNGQKVFKTNSVSSPSLDLAPKSFIPSDKIVSDLHLESFPMKNIQKFMNTKQKMDPIEFFTVWDLAGQSYLFCMHSMFLSPRAVYLLPVDLSVSLDAKVYLRTREKGRLDRREMCDISYLDVIQYWIQTIYSVSRSDESEKCNSRIIIVFTKSDKIENPEQKAQNDFKIIKNSLIWKNNSFSIVAPIYHIVSAKVRTNESFENLKRSIHENAVFTRFDHPLPIRWIDFALRILASKNSVLGQTEIQEFANVTECAKDYSEILDLFHLIGVFYFRKNILIKSLPDLLDVILRIVSPNYCLEMVTSQEELLSDIKKAENEAILTDGILDSILIHNNLFELKSEIVQLLMEFGVILYRKGESSEYYIPYLFTGDLSSICERQQNDLVLYLYFPDGLIPTSFYFAFLSHSLSQISNKMTTEPKLAFDCLKFQWKDITWVIDFSKRLPYINIILQGIDFGTSPDIISLMCMLESWVVYVQRKLILSWNSAKIALECPCKSLKKSLTPCVYLETFRKCAATDEYFYCKTKRKYFSWNFFNKKINLFNNIPPEFGSNYLIEHKQTAGKLRWKAILRCFYEKRLIDSEELANIFLSEDSEKSSILLQTISNKNKKWGNIFYDLLKSTSDNQALISSFESFIIDSFKSKEFNEEFEPDFFHYPFVNNPCGICLIFNFETFEDLKERKGSVKDVLNLKDTFEKMNFNVHDYHDLNESEFRNKIEEFRQKDYSNYDAFFCIIMSHGGENDVIYTADHEETGVKHMIGKDYIIEQFKAGECISLADKPKVFILQTCRGGQQDLGVMTEKCALKRKMRESISIEPDDANQPSNSSSTCPSQETSKKVATYSDTYIAQATVKGYKSYRDVEKGSIFISNFCSVIKTARFDQHFADIMVEVRRKVTEVKLGNRVQCPEDTNRFRKKLFLV